MPGDDHAIASAFRDGIQQIETEFRISIPDPTLKHTLLGLIDRGADPVDVDRLMEEFPRSPEFRDCIRYRSSVMPADFLDVYERVRPSHKELMRREERRMARQRLHQPRGIDGE